MCLYSQFYNRFPWIMNAKISLSSNALLNLPQLCCCHIVHWNKISSNRSMCNFFRIWGRSLFGSHSLLVTTLIPGSFIFVVFLQTKPQFSRISIITFFADRLQINFIELGLDSHFLVTGRASKVINTPGFIQSCEHIPLNDLITSVAQVTKKLVIVGFAVGQTFSLVMPITQKGFFTFRTYKVLHMPMFS